MTWPAERRWRPLAPLALVRADALETACSLLFIELCSASHRYESRWHRRLLAPRQGDVPHCSWPILDEKVYDKCAQRVHAISGIVVKRESTALLGFSVVALEL